MRSATRENKRFLATDGMPGAGFVGESHAISAVDCIHNFNGLVDGYGPEHGTELGTRAHSHRFLRLYDEPAAGFYFPAHERLGSFAPHQVTRAQVVPPLPNPMGGGFWGPMLLLDAGQRHAESVFEAVKELFKNASGMTSGAQVIFL